MKREDGELEEFEERDSSSDSVDASEEDEGSSRISEEEVVEVEILDEKGRRGKGTLAVASKERKGQDASRAKRAHLLIRHALDLGLLKSRDHSVLGGEVDDLGIGITEIELLEEIV